MNAEVVQQIIHQFIQPWLPFIGVALPIVQRFVNHWFSQDRKLFGILIKAEEQRFILACIFSVVAGIIITVTQYGWNLEGVVMHSAETFVASQVAYRLLFKRLFN